MSKATIEDPTYEELLSNEADEWGADDLDESVLDDLEEEEEEAPVEKRTGTDTVMKRLRDTDPEAASLLLEMQQAMSRSINDYSELRHEVLNLRESVGEQKNADGTAKTEETPETLPEGVTADNLEFFKKMANAAGFVDQKDLRLRDQAQKSTDNVQNALLAGVEQFGDAFGTLDSSGNVVVNPEVSARLEQRLQSLQDPNLGITPYDLYRLEFPDSVAQEKEAEAPRTAPRQRTRQKSNVARRTTSGKQKIRIYDPKRGDTPEEVLERAWLMARREQG